MSAPWPFVAWGMDVIEPIEPTASNMHRFILVAIDYFTKWVEPITFKSVTKKAVVNFVHSNIIYRFRIPKLIITDNAANLNNHLMKEIVAEAEIDDDEWVKTRLEQLSLTDKKRLAAVCHRQLYQKRMAREYNKKAEAKGKFAPNWQEPFIVTRMLPNGALYLADIEGKCIDMTINSDAVKRYYV
ncbi:uncharacterized protein [Nicotiana sylvestris]|uniref:uncharacterized protein n=1 Tax=Nicotiana sylvestris TaxID=4096 RepID=UPI00388CBF71